MISSVDQTTLSASPRLSVTFAEKQLRSKNNFIYILFVSQKNKLIALIYCVLFEKQLYLHPVRIAEKQAYRVDLLRPVRKTSLSNRALAQADRRRRPTFFALQKSGLRIQDPYTEETLRS
ncbi:LdOrf-8 peptide [Lymantria dispar multiple nucleopolyhedrovirus]|jgi:hypothetical protein|uniref:LdOrf-8 peptide n=1 Tax=Lymantria dispar multicapsid nuclear polyhedrosis virus TaxID=10449 RepID=Q9YMW6_NPVLD|nr:LdOrf-8 peptide [Lymantria dispar multiple nucleopolyhedrovirus]AAC70193.1 LdOrf-8 peptide [Lymantria dispar multiple nucleopolyhedrovirus]AMO27860.1 hypothetical protein [Lymantria dispar multiple nucleopolyhedrovirus]